MEDAGTFWSHEDPGGDVQTSLQKLLSMPEPDLDAILDHEETIQELKFFNEPLAEFLAKKDIVEKLIRYTIEIPQDADQKEAKRFPYVASELFACEVPAMLQAVLGSEDLLRLLFTFVEQEGPIDPRNSGYFRKVVGVLANKHLAELEGYLKKNPGTMRTLAKKVSLHSVMEILVMIGWDITMDGERNLDWIADAKLVPTLIDQIAAKEHSSAHENAASALIALVQTCGAGMEPNVLIQQLESKESIQKLCSNVTQVDSRSSSKNALRVLVAITHRISSGTLDNKESELPFPISAVVKDVLPYATKYLAVSDEKTQGTLELQYGRLSPPLGALRLEHMRLVAELVRVPSTAVQDALADSGIITVILKLMLQYPFNNLLHNLVHGIVLVALESGEGKLRDKALLGDAKLASTILSGFDIHLKRTEKRKADRMGYTAHLIVFSNALEECAEEDKKIRKHLDGIEGWNNFVKGPLENENKNQDTPLGGRKPQTHLQSDSDDDSEQHGLGRFGMDDDFDVTKDPSSEGTQHTDPDAFADAFEAEWESQAKDNVSAQESFEQAVDGKQNSWDDGEFEDPFAETPATSQPTQKSEDDFENFDAAFGSQDSGNTKPTANEDSDTVEKNPKSNDPDNFDDFDAAFS
mmetsp:Transcript_4904/g.11739  ORF Transcript_4904/g.11739 Transcript_4904/m.11739 type:complete len:638 (-) Transcript_4904:356-2269(-)